RRAPMSTSTDCIGERSTTRPASQGAVAGRLWGPPRAGTRSPGGGGRCRGAVLEGPPADSNAKPGVGSELQGSGHVRGAGAPRDYGRSTVDHAVPDTACEVVIMMPGHNHLTGDLTGELAGVDERHGGHLPTVDAPRGCQS